MTKLIIGRFFSNCSACGGNAMPGETYHLHGGPRSGWSKGSSLDDTNGCGAEFDEGEEYPYGTLELSIEQAECRKRTDKENRYLESVQQLFGSVS